MKDLLVVTMLIWSISGICQNNYSIELDGVDDYIEYEDSIVITSFPISFQADVKLAEDYQNNLEFTIFKSDESDGNYAGFWTQIRPSIISVSYGDGNGAGMQNRRTIKAPHSIAGDTWVNIAGVINGPTDMTVFVDGVAAGGTYDGTGGAYHPSNGNKAVSGYSLSATIENFSEGRIDNLSIWDIELTAAMVNDYIDCPPTGNETGLVAFWNFEEGSGVSATDQTGHGYNGALLNGASWSSDVPSDMCIPAGVARIPQKNDRTLLDIFDLYGRKTQFKPNTVLIYKYNDGSAEMKVVVDSPDQ